MPLAIGRNEFLYHECIYSNQQNVILAIQWHALVPALQFMGTCDLILHAITDVYSGLSSSVSVVNNCRQNLEHASWVCGRVLHRITSLTVVYSTVYSDADERKYQSSTSPAFVRRIHRWPVNSAHKWPVTQKMFPFDDVIIINIYLTRWFKHIFEMWFSYICCCCR